MTTTAKSSTDSRPLLSVVIATRNRAQYAASAVLSILAIQDARLQLVIQDNSDSPELRSLIRESLADCRLQYHYTPPPFSMIDNFNAAVGLASGEYICVIGDDDGVNPEIIEAIKWARDQGVDAIRSPPIANYFWPDLSIHRTLMRQAGRLYLYPFSGSKTFPDQERELARLASAGGQDYLFAELPKVYHGVVRRSCLEAIRDRTGAYFKGLSPDIFASIACATVSNRVCSIDYPLTISGSCVKSAAGDSAAGKHSGSLKDAPHFRNREAYAWPKEVPKFYSVETIWAESAVVGFAQMGRSDLLQQFDIQGLQAKCLINHPRQVREVLQHVFHTCNHNPIDFARFIRRCLNLLLRRMLKSANHRLKRRLGRPEYAFVSTPLETINDAVAALSEYLRRQSFSLTKFL